MALPTLDATFASSADLPRKQMLAKWLVEELEETQAPSSVLVSGAGSSDANGLYIRDGEQSGKPKWTVSGSANSIVWDSGESAWIVGTDGDYYFGYEDVAYPWLVQSFAGIEPFPSITEIPQPSPLSNYYSLPERYLWAKIAVAAGGPKTEADYISLPKNYAWSDIYNAVSGDIANSTVVVSGFDNNNLNGIYLYVGIENGRPKYELSAVYSVYWDSGQSLWIFNLDGDIVTSSSDVAYPWLATDWSGDVDATNLVLIPQTPNHTDWSENVALGHIAAAYRGDTGNPANLATYIDWPWRYKVASIIQAL